MDLTRKGLSRTVLDRDFIGPQISRPRGTGCCETGIFRDGPKQAMRDYKTRIFFFLISYFTLKKREWEEGDSCDFPWKNETTMTIRALEITIRAPAGLTRRDPLEDNPAAVQDVTGRDCLSAISIYLTKRTFWFQNGFLT